ncbi:MAG: flagellin, partial [Selenomonas sp.]|nr:flagellin [Selenomonas sp.]
MAMVVKNNKESINTLNTLNKNSAALSKSLQKVSSGMKINGAADDASGYAISEKMRVRIRGLDQAKANTQNATSMLKTAEGALQSNIDIMKTLKEKAIDAANDTNTDMDRATIQKEIDQMVSQMDDNASATFNGKPLFDTSNQVAENVNQQIIKALNSEWIQNSLE